MENLNLSPCKCPECGSSERIALDFEAVDRRYVLGIDENGTTIIDENEFDTISEGAPIGFWCLKCDHEWQFGGGNYDTGAACDVEMTVATPLALPGEGANVVTGATTTAQKID